MQDTSSALSETSQALRSFALRLPETVEGVACQGTALEKRTIKARTKAFVFLGVSDAMLKLSDSLGEAQASGHNVGAHGWVTVTFGAGLSAPERERMERWIEESYRLIASKKR